MKNLVFLTLLLTMFFLGAVGADAANHYVRAGASGSANGNDWTNAYTTLPATLTRGDTYYIADGTYTGRTFNTAANGTTLITIKKATVADHGTSTGWDNTFGDGQAVFTSTLQFLTSYWVVDGQVGGGPGSWTSGHGFKITPTGTTRGIFIGDPSFNARAGNITVSHFEVLGNNDSSGGGSIAQDGVTLHNGTGPNTIRYFYIHEMGRCPFLINGADDFLVEYGVTGQYRATGSQHSEVMSTGGLRGKLTIRYNLITHVDNQSTGGLMLDTASGGSVDIYGNVFYRLPGDSWAGSNNGGIGGWTGGGGEKYLNISIYNNTFININNPGNGTFGNQDVFGSSMNIVGNNVSRNNLFYMVSSAGKASPYATFSHNHFISTPTIGTNATADGGDPFVDYVNLNFRLKAATPAGFTLASPYNVDMFGTVRGADGVWDRGAVEFGTGGGTVPPSAPSNLRVQ